MVFAKAWFVVSLLACLCTAALPQGGSRFALTAQQVAQTLSTQGVQIEDVRVSMLAHVVATERHPLLDVISVSPFGERMPTARSAVDSLVKIGCRVPGVCLPFYVVVKGSERPAALGVVVDTIPTSKSIIPLSSDIVMRVGARAILQIDDRRSHVQVTVISLQNGKTGERIRVASPDHKQVYTAQVMGPSRLKWSY